MKLKGIILLTAFLASAILLAGCTNKDGDEAENSNGDNYSFPGIIEEFTIGDTTATLEYSDDGESVTVKTPNDLSYVFTLNADGIITSVKTSMFGVLLTNFQETEAGFPKAERDDNGNIIKIEYSKFTAELKRNGEELSEIAYVWNDADSNNRTFDKNNYAHIENIKYSEKSSDGKELFGTVLYFMSMIDMLNSAE